MEYKNYLDTLRHSCAHIMAQAVVSLWPDVKVAIGPAIENGFYYDFEKAEPFSEQDLKKIEHEMQRIVNRDPKLVQSFMSRQEALAFFEKRKERYKVEIIRDLSEEQVSIFTTGEGDFVDLCKGPHVQSAGEIKAFKLLSVAGAYWRGDEKRPMLQRIYGTCFETKEELEAYLNMLKEAERRDHRKLGTQMELFQIYHEQAGAGLVFYHPQGAMLRKIIEDYVREKHLKNGYQFVQTPNILKGKLWEQSGHSGYYRENMYYFQVDDEEYAVKPMNCPGHMLIYNSKIHSYREFPIRFFELGTVYRQEKAGVLHGLLRVRGFTQDDAHIFCRADQLKGEIKSVLDFVFSMMKDFGFQNMEIEVSTKPQKYIGRDEDWEHATEALECSLKEKNIPYKINAGDGAFYGPKIDIKLKDAIGRSWQCATIQCDFSLPERFDLTYMDEDGTAKRPIMIHRAVLGSVERFIGTLIEHYAGNFPVWLAPTQAIVIPIKTEHEAYAQSVMDDLQRQQIRVIMDNRNESLSKRIRESTMKKVPYVLVIGDKEQAEKMVSVRKRGNEDLGSMSVAVFSQRALEDIQHKR
ncbi:MAG TPA: threonine--tRNA ligase [Candidatus Omnitrophota bacterium]|nr:threonine--tRNA ligase [Candidatus Omnitrophota bacterium]